MKLREIIEKLNLKVRGTYDCLDKDVAKGYASDLLSDVLAHSQKGDVWITLQTHQNVVAVASMKELSGIVIISGREPEEDTVRKAEEENIPIMTSELPAFELICRLYDMGISGTRDDAEGV